MLPQNSLYSPIIFARFANVNAVLTLRAAGNFKVSVGDDQTGAQNRARLAQDLGFSPDHLIVPKQPHKASIAMIPGPDDFTQADGSISNTPAWLLGVTVADCAAILIYDPANQAVAAVHSGWRGTKAQILPKTIQRLQAEFGSRPQDLYVYVSPLGQKCCYEVQADFLPNFDTKYFEHRDGKIYFDNQAVIRDQLITASVPLAQVELDNRCTIHDPTLRSHRRDGDQAGRMLVAIGLKP